LFTQIRISIVLNLTLYLNSELNLRTIVLGSSGVKYFIDIEIARNLITSPKLGTEVVIKRSRSLFNKVATKTNKF